MGAFAKTIINKNNLITSAPTLTTSSNNTNDASGLYKSTDTNSGDPTYYFRGNVTNNYVKFAGYTWRIVRINEDGTIRIVMQDGINSNNYYKFNTNYNNYTYMYYSNSEIKTTLENWYNTNIGDNSDYSKYVINGDYFCEQAKVKSGSEWTSGNATMTLYSSYTPNFKCSNDGNGKGVVNANIGLLTYDEAIYAGEYTLQGNNDSYLYNNIYFWTMSPAGFSSGYSYAWNIRNVGGFDRNYVVSNNCLRPVINLKADIKVSGTGTSSDPYIIIESLKESIMKNNTLITTEPTLTKTSLEAGDKDGLYFSTNTDNGNPTYYFRGNVTNNYVKFAGFTWRIVRINEDGTIRLIMQDGIDNDTSYYYGNGYKLIDYMYFSNSNIKTVLESWYSKYLNEYDSKISYGNYCDELHAIFSEDYNDGNGTIFSQYTPSYKCSDSNRNLYIKIGLITYDEYRYAGGYHSGNTQFYLITGKSSWIMGPAGKGVSPVTGYYIWRMHYAGGLASYYITDITDKARPVINLKADIKVSGIGTRSDPYVVK